MATKRYITIESADAKRQAPTCAESANPKKQSAVDQAAVGASRSAKCVGSSAARPIRSKSTKNLGRIAVIANPAAQNGNGVQAAKRVRELLTERIDVENFDLYLTKDARHAIALVKEVGASVDTVVALGGDGVVNEMTNGLMAIEEGNRPRLGVIPVGSGNDYAATLGMTSSLPKAIDQLIRGNVSSADVGLCNGHYFVETLSFGLDAAIALDTMERRKRTGRTGTLLYLESGIDQLFHHLAAVPYEGTSQDAEGVEHPLDGSAYLFAIQIGPTYGGHFRICPDASINDGLFDLCIAYPPLGIWKAMAIFLLAKNGHHTRCKQLEFLKAKSLTLHFPSCPPAQIDGERFQAYEVSVSIIPRALEVITAP